MDKNYLQEIRKLESKIDIEKAYLSYEDTFSVIRDFFKTIILSESLIQELKIGEAAKKRADLYIKKSDDYTKKIISEDEFNSQMAEAWGDFKLLPNLDQKLIRLILCCLIGKRGYLESVSRDMQDNYISLILVLSYRLAPKLGKIFREFLESHPAMEKYKIQT
jgi:hypothetical protein